MAGYVTKLAGHVYDGANLSGEALINGVFAEITANGVKKVTAVIDIGRVINPQTAHGQVEGGLTQALGYAVMEKMGTSPKTGLFDAARLQTYIVPTALDTPEYDISFVEYPYFFAPPGAKGLGELPMDGLAPAIANAIFAATGVRLRNLPLTAESIFAALHPS